MLKCKLYPEWYWDFKAFIHIIEGLKSNSYLLNSIFNKPWWESIWLDLVGILCYQTFVANGMIYRPCEQTNAVMILFPQSIGVAPLYLRTVVKIWKQMRKPRVGSLTWENKLSLSTRLGVRSLTNFFFPFFLACLSVQTQSPDDLRPLLSEGQRVTQAWLNC